jgi:hypothetical protein
VHLDRLERRLEMLELAVERTKKPVSSVRYSVSTPGSRSEGFSSGIAPAAVDGLERALRRIASCIA